MSELTFGSLFAGIGGIDLGFERCGMRCKWQVEINDYATKVLEKHWPEVHRERDIRQCGASNLERVDIIAGGFPCQDISYAGLGAGLDGERSGLFFEAVRLVRELRPRAVVLENVSALLTRGLDRALGTLAEIGYDAQWHCIPAAYVGAPHIRDRVFVIGFQSRNADRVDDDQKQKRNFKNSKSCGTCGWSHQGESPALADTNFPHAQGQRQEPIGVKPQFRDASHESWWAVEPAVGRVAHGIPRRVDRLRGLGNAVVPQVAELVGRMVIDILSRQSLQSL
jgi:DNA (cytosine-5)-methyltransferase 1